MKEGTKVFEYTITKVIENEHPVFGTLYVLQSPEDTIQLYELELMNNIDLWSRRVKQRRISR